ncbi:hypothetical protein N7524_011871 [Penicillium chrysogenum]|nr:hypothetical protein N7524_011871 [Penicillium chrysogenum]
MAVLGRGEAGWRTAESYPPTLSKVIKVARFMVVHKALKLDPTVEAMLYQLAEHQMAGGLGYGKSTGFILHGQHHSKVYHIVD